MGGISSRPELKPPPVGFQAQTRSLGNDPPDPATVGVIRELEREDPLYFALVAVAGIAHVEPSTLLDVPDTDLAGSERTPLNLI